MEVANPNYSTSKSKEEVYAEDNFINPLPRAVIRQNSPILLEGGWHFSLDPDDKACTMDGSTYHSKDA